MVGVDLGTPWAAVVDHVAETGEPYVVHDPLCPLTPPGFVAACVATALAEDAVVVAVRPVTDTVKTVAGGLVTGTVDRAGLLTVASPVVLPPSVVTALAADPGADESWDLAAVVARLARRFDVVTLEAPADARRIATVDDLPLLEAGPATA